MTTNANSVILRLNEIASGMRPQLAERQGRRHLDLADFAALRDAGFFLTGVPEGQGGLWRGLRGSIRTYGEMVYAVAKGDPSVALVASMHPVVLAPWLEMIDAPEPFARAWTAQRDFCIAAAKAGEIWGTMTSEPGSGGDILKTRTRAVPGENGKFLLTGDKHFGSGSGISSYMITTARGEGADLPNIFFMDMKGRSWDGSDGLKIAMEWDGHGMCATQSHAFHLENMPATPMAWPDAPLASAKITAQISACLFTSVILAVVESAVELASQKLGPRRADMRAFERVGWSEIVNQAWTMRQVYNGMIDAVEAGQAGEGAAVRGKTVAAELAEACMANIGRVVGGGAFSRSAPFGQWAQDVRALGFLRPPWGLAYDQLFDLAWDKA